jgi:hypothetical protein
MVGAFAGIEIGSIAVVKAGIEAKVQAHRAAGALFLCPLLSAATQ